MKTNWALICLSLLTVCTQANDALSRKADAYLQARTDAGEFSGTVLLARDGRTLFAKGYGFANEEWRIPNDVHTRFPVASITKTFTAIAVMHSAKVPARP